MYIIIKLDRITDNILSNHIIYSNDITTQFDNYCINELKQISNQSEHIILNNINEIYSKIDGHYLIKNGNNYDIYLKNTGKSGYIFNGTITITKIITFIYSHFEINNNTNNINTTNNNSLGKFIQEHISEVKHLINKKNNNEFINILKERREILNGNF
jgi:hypothetical protein